MGWMTRRAALRRGTAILVGSGAAVAFPAIAEATDGPARTGHVDAVQDGAVRLQGESVWLETRGFPPGWEIEVGDRVAVLSPAASGDTEDLVYPLVHWEPGVLSDRGLVSGAPGGPEMRLEPATIYSSAGASNSQGSVMACVADHQGGGPDRVIAIRDS